MAFLNLVCYLALGLHAQTPAPDGLVSPEVRPDRTVTFRVRAPKASEAALYGDWMKPGTSQPMSKGAEGVWSITTAPLEANVHLYWFILDGVAVADPVNPVIKLRQRTSASLVEIPASPAAPWEVRDVPHGAVVTEWTKSAALGRTERIVVYLPPGYESSKRRYPILYLVHGSGDTPDSWTNAGHANLILDSLIADGKAKPMIIVMPAGHAVPFGTRQADNSGVFEKYLTTEVIPTIEKKYRVAPGVKNRALAGLSMGGGHTIYTGFRHPELFSVLAPFSAGPPRDFDLKNFHVKAKLIWVACGDADPVYERAKPWVATLEKAGLNAKLTTYQGAHTWPVWRMSLAELAPLLFK